MNVVVTHGFGLANGGENCHYAMGIEESLVLAERLLKKSQKAYIIGGATMYEQFSPYVDRYLITQISKEVPDGDTFFNPRTIGDLSEWSINLLSSGDADVEAGDEASFKIYEFTAKNPEAFAARRRDAVTKHQSKSHFVRREAVRKQASLAPA
jgi:dihydrofolate reductase